MDDDYDNYVPQISTMDYSLLQQGGSGTPGGAGGANGSRNTFLYESGQPPGMAGMATANPSRSGSFSGMMPSASAGYAPGIGDYGAASSGGMPSHQVYPPGFGPSAAGGMMPAQMQMQRQQMGQFPPPGAGYGMPSGTKSGSAAQQQSAQSGSKAKGGKKSKKAAAESANTPAEQGMGQTGAVQLQMAPGTQYNQMSQQQMAFYYKGQAPPPGMISPQTSQAQSMQELQKQKWLEEQQKQQQLMAQQQQMGNPNISGMPHSQQQSYGQQQQQQGQQPMYNPDGTVAGQMQLQQHPQYPPGYLPASMIQQQQPSKQAAQKSAMAPGQQVQPGHPQPNPYNMAQQQQFYAGPHQQPQPYPTTSQQMPSQSAQYPSQGSAYPQMQYPTMDYAAQQAAAMQRQAYYAQQQQMGPGGPMAAGNPYYQPYMNQYMAQQQQIYREMFECDQQLSALMSQPQQNPEMAMRVEKLQMHRGYLQNQMMQLQQHAAAAAAAASGGGMAPMGMAPNAASREQQQQQYPQAQQYPPYSGQQQQQQQTQQDPSMVPAQQKLAPSSQPPPYASGTTPAYQHPPAPQPQSAGPAVSGFHSPSAQQPATPVGPQQHQQMPIQQQQQQPISQHQQQYPHHMAPPSVAVMSASNQVQVNIRPAEMPGRTLISVYHSQDIPPTAVVSSATMQPYPVTSDSSTLAAAAAAAAAAAKDSIPPEPVPSNIAQLEKHQQLRRQQRDKDLQHQREQQQPNKGQPAKPFSPPLPFPREQQQQKELLQSRPEMVENLTSSSFQMRVLGNKESSMPIEQPQPHQLPQPLKSPKTPKEKEESMRSQLNSPAEEAQLLSPAQPILSKTPPAPISEQKVAVSLQFVAAKLYDQSCATTQPISLRETVEISLKAVVEKKKEEEPKVEEDAKEIGKEMDGKDTTSSANVEDIKIEPINELQTLEEGQIEPILAETEGPSEMDEIVGQSGEKAKEDMEEEPTNVPLAGIELKTITPSTSDVFLSMADDKESTADDSVWGGAASTKETTPMDADEQLSFTPKPSVLASYSLPPGTSSSRSAKSKAKKRRQTTLDWNRDEDDEYVGSGRKKKRKGKKELMEEEMEEDVVDPEEAQLLLLEKRRSMRKVPSGKKAKYGVDSEEEEPEAEQPSGTGTPMEVVQQQQQLVELDERIVEKILGARWGKRKVGRKEEKSEEEKEEKEGKKEGEENDKKTEDKKEEEEGDKMEVEGQKEEGEDKKEKEKDKKEANGKKDDEKGDQMEVESQKEEEKDKKEKDQKEADDKKEEERAKEMEANSKKEKEESKSDAKKSADQHEEKQSDGAEGTSGKDELKEKLEKDDDEEEEVEVEEFYVKYKNYSYLHCEWKTIEELEESGDRRVLAKVNRYKQKFGETTTIAGEDDEQEYFNDDNTVVARILDETYDEQEQQHYVFVKWKALSYDECTWELLQNVPEQKVEEFRRRIKFDPCKAKETSRLSPAEWKTKLTIPKDKVYKNDNMLREYQHEGVNWLLWTWTNGRNCILADEMGLGKTVQTIAFFQSLYDIGIHGPFLVVVPLSTLSNWEREFENWTEINAIVYHGGAQSRQIIQNYEFFYKKSDRRRVTKFEAMITTYEVVVQEVEVLRKINFRVCVIDEAHRIKNRNCKLLQSGLLSLKMEYRVLLTGTPLQNNIQELFSLLNFLEPEQFANSEAFLQQFGQCQSEEQVQKLQEILKPMMLRRLKEDVEKELQPKEETIIEVQLSNIQKKYYRAVLERNFTHLMKGTTPSLINTMMQLRKCCNHPYLINGAEEQILAEVKHSHPEKTEDEIQTMALISSSGKLVLIDKLLPKLHADGHKVLIFSQMVRVLDLLEEYLSIKSYPFERIDGNIRGNERQAAIDRFSRPENYDRFVFLLCTRAGGLGINLTAADTVIIFDSDWNPQNDLQAQARCHRIGQTKPVKIYRLITANSYEREMFDKASLKLGLDKAVLQSMLHKSDNNQQMSRQEVEDLLRKGAYGAIMDEDNEGTKFSEEDIDTILLRRTQTIRLEPGIKGSTFAKASFTSSHNREDIDIQDPDFWSKWAKKANIDVNALNDELSTKHLIVHEPRARKKRFEAENLKGNSESGDEGLSDDDESQSTPGTSKIAEGVKSRSSKRKRRGAVGEEDDDYPYKPDELAFNKSSYFKVEKLLAQFGWDRWPVLKAFSELTEHEIEHISRTLLLHCVREFRGDDKIRDYVWKLITPTNETSKTGEEDNSAKPIDTSRYHQGWAALPEYNPPFICVDASFQRHLHRHSNKLLNRIQHLQFLKQKIVHLKAGSVATESSSSYEDELKVELPNNLDNWLIMPNWDRQCDRDLLFGVYKHGMDNWDQVRADPKLCYTEKNIQFPNTIDLNNRFKYLVSMLQKTTEIAQSQPADSKPQIEWTKVEESDFMRILRNYGVKDDTNSENVISWGRFRELSICLQKKTDADLLEMLYCVLAMCTKQQGGGLSAIDERRAERVEMISAKTAEKLMNRLHLMRKVHAIITMGIQNIRGMLKMVSLDVMPKGWSEAHDEHLLIVVDKFGLEDIHGKVKLLPKLFESVAAVDENMLLRRVVEICMTLETGKWSGPASIEMVQEEGGHNLPSTSTGAKNLTAKSGGTGAGNGRKKMDQSTARKASSQQPADKSAVAGSSSGKNLGSSSASKTPSMSYNDQQSLLKMMEQMTNPNYLLSLMMMNPAASASTSSGVGGAGASSTAALQQQFQQLQTLLALSALGTTDPSLAGLSASLAGLGSTAAPLSSSSMPTSSKSQTSVITTDAGGKMDALNLSKRNVPTEASRGTSSGSSTKIAAASSIKTSAKQSLSSSTDATGSLSTGLSTSAINKLSQMSVPELLAYSNLSQEIRIPVVHIETGQRIESEKAPMLKNLDQWLKMNPKYNVDLLSLATSHPSLFSSTNVATCGPKTPVSTPKPTTSQKSLTSTQDSQKDQKESKPTIADKNIPVCSSVTQQLIEQSKKSSITGTSADLGKSASTSLPSTSASSLFGLGDSAQQMAALNQFLTGLTPSGLSALQASNLASATGLTGTGTLQQSPSLKSIEQQMLLLQQAMALGGSTAGIGSTASGSNPYASFLYMNPADLFGVKSSQPFGASAASIPSPALQQQASSTSSVDATMAALMAAAGMPPATAASAKSAADFGALSAAALTSPDLYLAAMASSLQPFLGTSMSTATTPTTAQNPPQKQQQQSMPAGMNAALEMLQKAGMDPSALLALSMPSMTTTTTAAQGKTGTTPAAGTKMSSKVEAAKTVPLPKTTALQQQKGTESPARKTGLSGVKGLKLNAVLEKLSQTEKTSGTGASASTPPAQVATDQADQSKGSSKAEPTDQTAEKNDEVPKEVKVKDEEKQEEKESTKE